MDDNPAAWNDAGLSFATEIDIVVATGLIVSKHNLTT
jgi:hypothetical protein